MGCSKPDARSIRQAQKGRNDPHPPARKSFSHSHLQIINNQSSFINHAGFTLIELLAVISIIAQLLSLLMPSLQRVRRQAKATRCQANLHQWGIAWATYAAENDGYLVPADFGYLPPHDTRWDLYGGSPWPDNSTPEGRALVIPKGLRLCPMATRWERWEANSRGGTFLAWNAFRDTDDPQDSLWWSSYYATNHQAHSWWGDRSDPRCAADLRFMWMTSAVKSAAIVPVFLDSMYGFVSMYDDKSPPPEYDAIPTRDLRSAYIACDSVCINRHDGGINSLFMDWSVRKVGLKELWTLKWWSQYNTRGPWTKAGGAAPEDWPAWMRKFKDY